jgi:histidine triad (HIT) family protein
MNGCTFCAIAGGAADADLVALRTGRVFVIPAPRQRPRNQGHALVVPAGHVVSLHDAAPAVRDELFAVVAQLTGAVGALYGAEGSIVFQHNITPGPVPFHLHVHVVPRFPGDDLTMPDPAMAEVPRAVRLRQAAALRQALSPGR